MTEHVTQPTFSLEIPILYEDDDLLVINKPPGVVVNRALTTNEPTLQDWMVQQKLPSLDATQSQSDWQPLLPPDFDDSFGTPAEVFAERQGIVHRLDKDTSGTLVLAKNPGALMNLLAQFKRHQVTKEYLALVHGKIQAPAATLNYPIGRASQDRLRFAVKPEGRESITEYQVQAIYDGIDGSQLASQLFPEGRNLIPEIAATPHQLLKRLSIYQGFSLVSCWPQTGRTHQIRVHFSHIRHPLVGDSTYAGRKRQVLDPLWCPRHFLHAHSLRFTHPRSGVELSFSGPLWPDLEATLGLMLSS